MSDSPSWYIKNKEKTLGPFSSKQLKQFAAAGKITASAQVRQGNNGKWCSAGNVRGLFAAQPTAVALAPVVPAKPVIAPKSADLLPAESQPIRTPCPFCGENVAASAVKCRFCNEYLDGRPSVTAAAFAPAAAAAVAPAPAQSIVINNVVGSATVKRWSPLVAVILSIFLPGLGQMYKGQLLNGFLWLLITLVGYVAFIVPGLILHVFCVLGAASGDPYR